MSLEGLRKQSLPWDNWELEAYFNAEKRLASIGVSIPPEMRALEMVSAWPRLVVEAMVERLTPEGFYFADDSEVAKESWQWFLANRMDVNASLLHTEALVQGVAFGVVGAGQGDVPVYTAHTRREFRVNYNPLGQVREALQTFKLPDSDDKFQCHYEPGVNTFYGFSSGQWKKIRSVDSGVSRIPVVAFVNRSRIENRSGESEMRDVMAISDACSRSLTNLQVAQELVAMPVRYMTKATKDSFKRPDGTTQTQFEAYIGRLLLGPEGAQIGQLPGAQLSEIINTVKLYAQQVASITGLPNSYLGINTDNPASGQALNAATNRHVKKAELKQVFFGDSHEDMARIGQQLIHGTEPDSLLNLELTWRNAATITLQEVGEAAAKLTGGDPVIPPKVARELIGLTPEQKRLADEAEAASAARLFGGTV